MPFCTSCGQPLDDNDRFCTSCGAPRDPGKTRASPPQDQKKAQSPLPQGEDTVQSSSLQDEGKIQSPLPQDEDTVQSPSPQDQDEIRWTAKVLGMASDFFVNTEGAGQEASKKTSDVNTGIAVGGTLLGSLTAAGAGILAKSRENDFIRWDETRTVALNNKKKTVTVTRKSLVFPIRLYCTGENYKQVVKFIRQHVKKALIKE
ncbi:MAG TPA: zinc-ribbon domain-containing protein [Methanoregulaceae archaeon]|nr:zinc-ribbon domain-containing protein [Methanoregulaceae archaeon]